MPIWDDVIEKIDCCLVGWKRMYLSKDRRITLIKSIISNLPKYFMSLLSLPTGVVNHIEKLQRNLYNTPVPLWHDMWCGDKPLSKLFWFY